MKKRLVSVTAILLVLVSVFGAVPAAAAEAEYGMIFNGSDLYSLSTTLPIPATIEATVELPKGFEGRGGVVIGNYDGNKSSCLNLEIHENGKPRLYIIDNNQKTYDVKFDKIDVREGKPVHIAVVYDKDTKKVSAYKDGVLIQTVSFSYPESIKMNSVYILGGDYRTGNTQYFKGKIHSLALWSDVRTTLEINADIENITSDADALVGAWDMSELKTSEPPEKILDIGPKKRNIKYSEASGWRRDGAFKGSYAYSFAVIGDTQKVTRLAPEKLSMIYDWIVENAEEKNTKFVIGLGDITDTNTDWEWEAAKAAIGKLDGIIPYSLVRGNHDGIAEYKNAFPISKYKSLITASYEGNMLNTYQTFEVGQVKYLILNLDCRFTPQQIDWANKVVEDHPDRNVIVTTHIYLTSDGNPQGANAMKYGAEFEAYELWDRLLKKHKNIVMIISGHSPCDTVLLSSKKGDNGNVVRQVLIDPQGIDVEEGLTGLVATFYFSEDGRKVNVDYYSTIKGKYRDNSNISFYLDVLEVEKPETTAAPETTASPETTAPAAPVEGGCGSFVGGGIFAILSLLGAAWVSKRS